MTSMSKAKTSARGYGRDHQLLRKALAPAVATGTYPCWRCGKLIKATEAWDLGHDDLDRSIYKGPEHVKCNRNTAGRARRRVAERQRRQRRANPQTKVIKQPQTAKRW